MVTHQLQVRGRPVKVRRPETDVLLLSHPNNWGNKSVECEMLLNVAAVRDRQLHRRLAHRDVVPVVRADPRRADRLFHPPGARLVLLQLEDGAR